MLRALHSSVFRKAVLAVMLIAYQYVPAHAQDNIIFYGVDFSMVRTYGISYDRTELLHTFDKINLLFEAEPEKYDVDKYTGRTISEIDLEPVQGIVQQMLASSTPKTFFCKQADYDCGERIDEQIAGYRLSQTEGEGIIIIANLLDKKEAQGSYFIVTFDIASRVVKECVRVTGMAGGFGLRNYWAASLHKALERYQQMGHYINKKTKKNAI